MLETYRKMVRFAGIKIRPELLLGVALLLVLGALAAFALGYTLLALTLIVLADVVAGVPYMIGERRLREFEENLPDALRQIATTLKSGGTFEMALREVAASGLGVTSQEFSVLLRDMEAGITFDGALERMAMRVPSDTLRRVVTIIRDAVKAGGGLADVLEDVSEDARELLRIKKERETKTGMQSMFITVASTILGPFIFGAAVGLMGFMGKVAKQLIAAGAMKEAVYLAAMKNMGVLEGILLAYVLIQAIISAFMVAFMRGEGVSGALKRIPLHLMLAYIIFVGGKQAVLWLTP